MTENLIGRRFSMLSVVCLGSRYGRKRKWFCLCDCGGQSFADSRDLLSGYHKSCGCLSHRQLAERSTRHGHAKGHRGPRAAAIPARSVRRPHDLRRAHRRTVRRERFHARPVLGQRRAERSAVELRRAPIGRTRRRRVVAARRARGCHLLNDTHSYVTPRTQTARPPRGATGQSGAYYQGLGGYYR